MGCDPLTFPLLLLLLLLKPPVVFLLFALHFKPRQKLVLQHHISEHLYLHRFSNRMSVSSHWQCVLSSFYHGVWLSAKENGSSRTVWVSVDSQLRCLTHTHTHVRTHHLLQPLLLFIQSYFDNVAATSLQTEVQPLHQLSETKQTLSTQHVHLGLWLTTLQSTVRSLLSSTVALGSQGWMMTDMVQLNPVLKTSLQFILDSRTFSFSQQRQTVTPVSSLALPVQTIQLK